jgi:hypothetical protein
MLDCARTERTARAIGLRHVKETPQMTDADPLKPDPEIVTGDETPPALASASGRSARLLLLLSAIETEELYPRAVSCLNVREWHRLITARIDFGYGVFIDVNVYEQPEPHGWRLTGLLAITMPGQVETIEDHPWFDVYREPVFLAAVEAIMAESGMVYANLAEAAAIAAKAGEEKSTRG